MTEREKIDAELTKCLGPLFDEMPSTRAKSRRGYGAF